MKRNCPYLVRINWPQIFYVNKIQRNGMAEVNANLPYLTASNNLLLKNLKRNVKRSLKFFAVKRNKFLAKLFVALIFCFFSIKGKVERDFYFRASLASAIVTSDKSILHNGHCPGVSEITCASMGH